MKHRFLTVLTAVGCAVGMMAGCAREIPEDIQKELETRYQSSSEKADSPESSSAPSEEDSISSSEDPEDIPPEPEERIESVTLKAVGDNLIHNTIYMQAQNRASGGLAYDFYPAYERVSDLLSGADFSFINQETLLASAIFEPSSYPMFNSPTEVGDTMLELGFNLFSHSNNHALDKGVKGIGATLDYWAAKEDEDILVTGLFRDENDLNRVRVMEKNGISLSLVAFTEHTNGLKLPSTSENIIIYTSDTETMKKQIEAADQAADVVIVSVHWGIENSHEVTDAQRNLAQQMFDWGADIILGTHPHVLQPIEPLASEDGEREGYVIYSLGNFISAQSVPDNLVAGILDFTIYKNMETGKISIGQPSLTPIVTHYETAWQRNLSLYPLNDYTEELAQAHGVRQMEKGKYSFFSTEYIWNMLDETIGEPYLRKGASNEENSVGEPSDEDVPPLPTENESLPDGAPSEEV